MSDQTPEDVLAEMRRLKAVPDTLEGDVQQDAFEVDGFADLDSFFDDSLSLPIRGKVYRIPPANAELGLLCSRLMMVGQQVARTGKASSGAAAKLDDSEEIELFERLLGHTPTLPGTGSPAIPAQVDEDGKEIEPGSPEVPDKPNPYYSAADDVWQQMFDDGLSWQHIQHVGATAMIWTAIGKPAAQEFWASGARPKAALPVKAPQDRKRKGTAKSGQPGSTGGTTNRAKKGKAVTAGTTSSGSGG